MNPNVTVNMNPPIMFHLALTEIILNIPTKSLGFKITINSSFLIVKHTASESTQNLSYQLNELLFYQNTM